ncbi:laccase-6 [Gossypium australe]|uniref:Laccase-6 n=1 Tax=Gossypium australe TaxID=47621 RepID=A0A5B6VZ46_9ROSI|nr:laccase-6 [Gossypium australe]
MEYFFMVANHTMTVVETDGEYTKPFKTTFLMLTPGQTYNVLIKADQCIGKYFMAMAPYMPAKNVPFLKKTSYGILRYASPTVKVDKLARKSRVKTSMTPLEPIIPNVNDTASVQAFSDQVKRLYPNHQWSPVDVPLTIDNWTQLNNVTFRRPMVSLLNAYYNNLQGYYSTDFPDKPEKMYDFVNGAPNNISVDTQPAIGTQVSILEHGWAVQVIFQDTGTVGTEKHPIHLHGFSFYLLGTGLGNYNSSTALLNLYDPPYRNTVGVPVGRWAVIRFRADNQAGSAHNMGAVNGFSSEEWERQNAEFATSTS